MLFGGLTFCKERICRVSEYGVGATPIELIRWSMIAALVRYWGKKDMPSYLRRKDADVMQKNWQSSSVN